MIRAGFLSGGLSLMFLMNMGQSAEPTPVIPSEAQVAYERQMAQAHERIQQRALANARDRTLRIEARKRSAGRLVPSRKPLPYGSFTPISRDNVYLIDPPPK